MWKVESKILSKLNKKGYSGFPILYHKYVNLHSESDKYLITDLIGSSLSQYSQ
jgi:hypothetical protein